MNKTQQSSKNISVFVLGRSPKLSLLELNAVFSRQNIDATILSQTQNIAIVKTAHIVDQIFFKTLGGCQKFGILAAIVGDQKSLIEAIKKSLPSDRLVIGFSSFILGINLRSIGLTLKRDRAVKRYIIPQKGPLLSAAVSKGIAQKKGQEFLLVPYQNRIGLVKIIGYQDIDDFTDRDRALPAADPLRGMLPTKLARIMVNLGLDLTSQQHPRVLDPFCGTGRVLLEALLLGCDIRGSDIDQSAVSDTIKNLTWLSDHYHIDQQPWDTLIKQSDIATVDKTFPLLFDVVVTEPDLGPPLRSAISGLEIDKIFDRLVPLYVTLFTKATTFLNRPGGLVVVFPIINNRSLLQLLVDKIRALGYNMLDSVQISRTDQIVGREIGLFSSQSVMDRVT